MFVLGIRVKARVRVQVAAPDLSPSSFLPKVEGREGEREGGEGVEGGEDERVERAGWWTSRLSGEGI